MSGVITWTTKDGQYNEAIMSWERAVKLHLALIAQGNCCHITTSRID